MRKGEFKSYRRFELTYQQAHLGKSLLKLKNLAVVIPLFLDVPAFAVYDQLKEEEKRDANKIKLALSTAFACDKF